MEKSNTERAIKTCEAKGTWLCKHCDLTNFRSCLNKAEISYHIEHQCVSPACRHGLSIEALFHSDTVYNIRIRTICISSLNFWGSRTSTRSACALSISYRRIWDFMKASDSPVISVQPLNKAMLTTGLGTRLETGSYFEPSAHVNDVYH